MPRPEKKYHYIYRTTCLATGKFYVGMHSTNDIDDKYLGSGKILGYSRKKYGDQNHKKEIIEMCPSREALKLREKEIVNEEMLANPLNINLKYGGEGGFDHLNSGNLAHRERASGAATKRNSSLTGTQLARDISKKAHETRRRRGVLPFGGKRNNFAGMFHTAETKMKMQNSQQLVNRSGENNPMFGKKFAWMNKEGKNKKVNHAMVDQFVCDGWIFGQFRNKAGVV